MKTTNKLETIGTDVSIEVCKNEGYLMLDWNPSIPFDPETPYNVYAFYPDYIREEFNISDETKMLDTFISFNALLEIYDRHKEGVNSFAETDETVNFKNPGIYDLLNLASDLNAYCGIG